MNAVITASRMLSRSVMFAPEVFFGAQPLRRLVGRFDPRRGRISEKAKETSYGTLRRECAKQAKCNLLTLCLLARTDFLIPIKSGPSMEIRKNADNYWAREVMCDRKCRQ